MPLGGASAIHNPINQLQAASLPFATRKVTALCKMAGGLVSSSYLAQDVRRFLDL